MARRSEVDDFIAPGHCASMNGVDVLDLYGDVRAHLLPLERIARRQVYLCGRVGG